MFVLHEFKNPKTFASALNRFPFFKETLYHIRKWILDVAPLEIKVGRRFRNQRDNIFVDASLEGGTAQMGALFIPSKYPSERPKAFSIKWENLPQTLWGENIHIGMFEIATYAFVEKIFLTCGSRSTVWGDNTGAVFALLRDNSRSLVMSCIAKVFNQKCFHREVSAHLMYICSEWNVSDVLTRDERIGILKRIFNPTIVDVPEKDIVDFFEEVSQKVEEVAGYFFLFVPIFLLNYTIQDFSFLAEQADNCQFKLHPKRVFSLNVPVTVSPLLVSDQQLTGHISLKKGHAVLLLLRQCAPCRQ